MAQNQHQLKSHLSDVFYEVNFQKSCGGICHQPDTFIKIGCGHTVLISQKAKLEPQDSSIGASVILHLVDSGSNKDKTFPLGVIENLETLLYVLAKYFDFPLKTGGEVRSPIMFLYQHCRF